MENDTKFCNKCCAQVLWRVLSPEQHQPLRTSQIFIFDTKRIEYWPPFLVHRLKSIRIKDCRLRKVTFKLNRMKDCRLRMITFKFSRVKDYRLRTVTFKLSRVKDCRFRTFKPNRVKDCRLRTITFKPNRVKDC